jgi:hypothetical protein
MHKQTEWKDHVTEFPNRRTLVENPDGTVDVVKAQGELIQQGTPQSATNFNNQENGIQDAHTATAVFLQYFMQFDRWVRQKVAEYAAEFLNEIKTVTLTNTKKFPFNDSAQTVNLATARKTLNYDISWEITSANGNVGDITISDKLLNGFKIAFDGSATSVTLKIRIKGGMLV